MTLLTSTYDGSRWAIADGELVHLDEENRCAVRWTDATHGGFVINAECTCGAVLHREGVKPRHGPIRQAGTPHREGPTPMTLDRAAEIVAQHIAVALLDDVHDSWDSYPEVGEHDWTLMAAKVRSLIAMPDPVELVAAYRYLAKRAEQ